jgi:hypothetical protein
MSQQTLNIFAPDQPFATDLRYVPLLLDRSGERGALRRADEQTWASMRPLIAVTRWGAAPSHGSLKNRASELLKAVETRPFYLDLADIAPSRLITARGAKRRTLDVLHDEAARKGLTFIPVARPTDGPRRLEMVADAVAGHGRGVALRHEFGSRVKRTGEGPADRLLRTLEAVDTCPEDADLLLDLRWLDPDSAPAASWLARQIQALSAEAAWRTITLAGTCVPRSVSTIADAADVGSTRRTEWSLWKEVEAATDVDLAYGDYAVQHPRVPSTGGRAFGNLRYTAADDLYVSRGQQLHNMDAGDFADMCSRIVAGPFSGQTFSWGDEQIHSLAQRQRSRRLAIYDEPEDDIDADVKGPSGHTFWREVGTSHHLKFVATQLAAHRAASRR